MNSFKLNNNLYYNNYKMKNIYRFVVVSLFVMSSLQIKLKDDMIDEDNSEEASSKIVLPFLAQ
jgi:hypothetical protein